MRSAINPAAQLSFGECGLREAAVAEFAPNLREDLSITASFPLQLGVSTHNEILGGFSVET